MKRKKPSKYGVAEVISVVSHQLKTPLVAIKGYLEVLEHGDLGVLNEEQKDYLKDALHNTDRMIDLVKDLLDVSKIEEGKMNLNLKRENFQKIVRETVDDFVHFAKAKNCKIIFQEENNIPSLFVDSIKIKQVINNLVSNAIKYSKKKGEVKITIEKNKGNIIFSCQDNGIGIKDTDRKKIFSKFFRSEKAVTIETEGSGLGLFISKAIIEMHGGKIWFISNKG